LAEQQKYNYGVVYAACTVGKNSRVLLLLPLSNHGPWDSLSGGPPQPPRMRTKFRYAGVPKLFYYDQGCVTNGALLAVEKHYLRLVEIVQGGVPEIDTFGNVARELAQHPLSFLPPDQVMEALLAKPTRQCHSMDKISGQVP